MSLAKLLAFIHKMKQIEIPVNAYLSMRNRLIFFASKRWKNTTIELFNKIKLTHLYIFKTHI